MLKSEYLAGFDGQGCVNYNRILKSLLIMKKRIRIWTFTLLAVFALGGALWWASETTTAQVQEVDTKETISVLP